MLKIFFEVFLRKVYLTLNPGETIKIKNFGYFQMRKGKINNTSASDREPIISGSYCILSTLERSA